MVRTSAASCRGRGRFAWGRSRGAGEGGDRVRVCPALVARGGTGGTRTRMVAAPPLGPARLVGVDRRSRPAAPPRRRGGVAAARMAMGGDGHRGDCRRNRPGGTGFRAAGATRVPIACGPGDRPRRVALDGRVRLGAVTHGARPPQGLGPSPEKRRRAYRACGLRRRRVRRRSADPGRGHARPPAVGGRHRRHSGAGKPSGPRAGDGGQAAGAGTRHRRRDHPRHRRGQGPAHPRHRAEAGRQGHPGVGACGGYGRGGTGTAAGRRISEKSQRRNRRAGSRHGGVAHGGRGGQGTILDRHRGRFRRRLAARHPGRRSVASVAGRDRSHHRRVARRGTLARAGVAAALRRWRSGAAGCSRCLS